MVLGVQAYILAIISSAHAPITLQCSSRDFTSNNDTLSSTCARTQGLWLLWLMMMMLLFLLMLVVVICYCLMLFVVVVAVINVKIVVADTLTSTCSKCHARFQRVCTRTHHTWRASCSAWLTSPDRMHTEHRCMVTLQRRYSDDDASAAATGSPLPPSPLPPPPPPLYLLSHTSDCSRY